MSVHCPSLGLRRRGFTLVDLLVAITILSIGIIFVLRSFLAVGSALNRGDNIFNALCFAEAKLADTEEELIKGNRIDESEKQGEFLEDNRKFSWRLEGEDPTEEEPLREISVKVFWKEGNRQRDISLGTYVRYKEKKE